MLLKLMVRALDALNPRQLELLATVIDLAGVASVWLLIDWGTR